MFLVTSITMLRERTTGTLERLMTMPLAKLDLLLGYGAGVRRVAAVQAALVVAVAFGLLDLDAPGPGWLGRRCSRSPTPCSGWRSGCSSAPSRAASSRPCSSCRRYPAPSSCSAACSCPATDGASAESLSDVLPMTYAYDALARVAAGRPRRPALASTSRSWSGASLLALALGAATLRRRTAERRAAWSR